MKNLTLLLIALICASSAHAQELTIIHFNDTHSHIDPERSGEYKGHGGAIERAAYIDSVRQADGKRNVLLLHAGDFSQGTSYFTEFGGDIEIDILNAMKYDAVCLGNHEFDNGTAELARRISDLDVPVVCANYEFAGTPLEGLVRPYVIVRKAGRKIGVTGLLTDIRQVVDLSIADGLEYLEPVSVVNPIADYLRDERGCDLVICLSHLGYTEDKKLASGLRGVDLIVGGHSHTLLDRVQYVKDMQGNDVGIVQNWKWGLNAAELKVNL